MLREYALCASFILDVPNELFHLILTQPEVVRQCKVEFIRQSSLRSRETILGTSAERGINTEIIKHRTGEKRPVRISSGFGEIRKYLDYRKPLPVTSPAYHTEAHVEATTNHHARFMFAWLPPSQRAKMLLFLSALKCT